HHWDKLPLNWQISLEDLNPIQIAELLDYEAPMKGKMWPLSLLALKSILVTTSLPRRMVNLNIESPCFTKDEKLLKLFWKNVKAKKRHEILIMSKICYQSANATNCFYIVDIGSGLGHLSRILNYGYGFKVCTIEAQELLSHQAKKLDHEFEKILEKKYRGCLNYHRTVHINEKIQSNITVEEFLMIIKNAFNIDHDDFKFGIVGLHPCGDLGATLLKLYNKCSKARYINIVGCCYMKLSTASTELTQGFPLSQLCKINKYQLSYHSREIACHAIENYIEKLLKGEFWRLQIHTYRAVLEKLITNKYPDYHHCALNNVKYTEDLTFVNYCKKAVKKLKITFPEDQLSNEEIEKLLLQWKKVVVFYSLRLLFAPLIETIIHFDRFLYVEELKSDSTVTPVFDSRISPRNHVLTAVKKVH
ncbi:RRNAD1, partial [Asbolus verrucosus]